MIVRLACVFYILFLAAMILFIGNPLKYVAAPIFVEIYKTIEPGIHIGLFAILSFLVAASRWPIHSLLLAVMLLILAAYSEIIQLVLPNRSPRWSCFVQDVIGLAVGVAIWKLLAFALKKRVQRVRESYPIGIHPTNRDLKRPK